MRPLIAISLSREVNEITQGDFTHTMDFPDGYISFTAGVPTIQYYDDEDKANSAFLNVPHMHTGCDKYTSQIKPLRQGRPIGVGDTGKMRLHWQKNKVTKVRVNLRCSLAIPDVGEANFIHCIQFTAEGIDIVDSEGDPFRKQIRKGLFTAASIERKQLVKSVGGQDLVDLWTAVREAHGHEISVDNAFNDDTRCTSCSSLGFHCLHLDFHSGNGSDLHWDMDRCDV